MLTGPLNPALMCTLSAARKSTGTSMDVSAPLSGEQSFEQGVGQYRVRTAATFRMVPMRTVPASIRGNVLFNRLFKGFNALFNRLLICSSARGSTTY